MSPVVTKKLLGSMEPIVIRKTRLKRMINGSEWRPYGNGSSFYNLSGKDLSIVQSPRDDRDKAEREDNTVKAEIDGEALLDAFVVLYDDCNSQDGLRKPVKYFLEKFETAVEQVKEMRVNVADFEIGDVIGRGRFSSVRLIREKAIRRIYALKTMNKFDGEVQRYLGLVDAEIAVLSKNASKWIVQLKYSFQDPVKLYFVMEYLPGGDLRSLLQRYNGKLDIEMARVYIGELVLAIHAVHSLGFAHRDITPENILFDQTGHLKLIDFGSSSKLKSDGTVSTSLFTLGSVTYIAPEVLRNVEDGDGEKGVRYSYGAECDFWSLGVVAYETIFGRVPFDSDEVIGIYNQIVSFKFQLQIPEGEMHEDLGHLLRGLLTVSKERLNYDDCLRHPFFNPIMWDGLRDDIPPYIPGIKPEEKMQFADSATVLKAAGSAPCPKERILDLPFVGFTRCYFNPPKTSLDNSSYAESTDGSFLYGDFKDDVTVKLQTELTSKTEALDERNKKVEELQKAVKNRDAVINSMETEKAKMLGEVKQLKVEKQQLNKNLEEELEVRKQIQRESQKLVANIKTSCESRISKLKEDLKMKEELNANKEDHIKEQDSILKQLRAEIQRLNGEVQFVKYKEGEMQGRLSKSYRGSISMMESELSRKSSELETRIKQIEAKYAEEIYSKVKEYEDVVEDLRQSLNEKNGELEEVKGRLEESRQAREATLEEMKLNRKKYTQTIQELEEKFDDAHDQVLILQKEHEKDAVTRQQVHDLEAELSQVRKTNDILTARVDLAERDVDAKESIISELESRIDQLKKALEDLETQKKELNETAQDCLRKTFEISQISAQKVLQEQLDKCQATCDTTKELLIEERLRTKECQEKISELQKQHGLAKVDVRILTRENRGLEEKCEKLTKECAKLNEQLELSHVANTTLQKSIADAEKTVQSLKTKSEEDSYDLIQAQQMYEEAKTEKSQLESCVKELKDESVRLKEQLQHFDKLRVGLGDRDKLLNEKDQQLDEKRRKIESLQMNIVVLKEASTVLDNQLRDFETAFTKKVRELQNSETARSELESEHCLVKEQLQKTRIDLNEAKSLKTFVEKRLNEVESSQKSQDIRSSSDMQHLVEHVDQLKRKNDELSTKLNGFVAEYENTNAAKNHLEQLFEKTKQDNAKLNEEISRTLQMVVNLKDQNIKLKAALEEALLKAESFKTRCEQQSADHELLELERHEKEIQLECTIKQQAKLIEHLQDKNDALGKKKDKKFHLFSKVKDDKESTPRQASKSAHTLKYTSTPIGKRSTAPTPTATPVRLVQEHRAVKNLEEKAASLKHQLAMLQDSKEVQVQKDPTLPTPKKEELVMLHKKPSTLRKAPSRYDNSHQFLDKTTMKTDKCWRCLEPIYFGKIASICGSCSAMFHVNCSAVAGDSCGLPKDAIIELEKRSRTPDPEFMTEDEDDEYVEGWVHIAGEKAWEKYHARIHDGKLLIFEDSSSSARIIQKFPLNGKTRVELRVNGSEVKIPFEQGKLPFMLKVVTPPENSLRAWDDNKCLYIITESKNQKRFWTRAIFKHSANKGSSSTMDSADLLDIKSEMSLSGIRKSLLFRDTEAQLDINCVFLVSNGLYLMGCEQGLYSHKVVQAQPSSKVKIEGVEAIYQMEFISKLNSVIMIEGSDRKLVIVHMGVLRVCAEAAACSKPKLTAHSVADIQNCHLFQHMAVENGEIYLAVATPKHFHILCWKEERFVTIKRINTSETVTCMLMNSNSVIFGCDRLYELDIKNFQLEDFIDNSDDTLYYLRFSCDVFSSFPVAILDVSLSNWQPITRAYSKEYLLCFSDMGVFVDAYGRRTRGEDIVWSRLPVAVAYRHPNLYILHFSSVEMIRLGADSYTRTRVIESRDSIGKEYSIVPESRFLSLGNPRLLGNGSKTASIVVTSVEKHKTEVIEVDLDSLPA